MKYLKLIIEDVISIYPTIEILKVTVDDHLCNRNGRTLADDFSGFIEFMHSNADDYYERFYYCGRAQLAAYKRVQEKCRAYLREHYGDHVDKIWQREQTERKAAKRRCAKESRANRQRA
jgi:hypothetical protein